VDVLVVAGLRAFQPLTRMILNEAKASEGEARSMHTNQEGRRR
jgi:hypothetical protein